MAKTKRAQSMQTLNDALILKLKALYDVESELAKALPKMAKKATDPDLKAALEDHLAETEAQADRLVEAFGLLDIKPGKTKVEGIRGIIADAEWVISEKPSPEALDSLIIASASYAEHYEIAGYTKASKWAAMLGYDQVAQLLEKTLEEEEEAEERLANIADQSVDERAMEGISLEAD